MEIRIDTIDGLGRAARTFVDAAGDRRVFLFRGAMGAGKTTLIAEICRVLGVGDEVASPTFSIINEYDSAEGPVYHFDFYRIDTPSDALDLGIEDYFESGEWCFVEWPEKIEGLLPDDAVEVGISVEPDGSRIVRMG